MTKLYSHLAQVYHEMYQSIFDYKKDFQFYNRLLKKYKCKKILEIGCGSGNLTPLFLKAGYDYVGLDLFKEMIKIAKKVEPKVKFIQGDMRKLNLKENFDAVLITGRSFTYLTTNEDVMNTLKSVHKTLKKNGVLIFDNFNAGDLIEMKKKRFVQEAKYKNKKYKRISEKYPNLQTGWTEDWKATYYVTENGKTKIIKDKSIIRAFTKDEIALFLKLNKFKILKNQKKDFVLFTIAQK
ncbi:class I SAM-dependent methyltransferase [Candidatus Woesearchaeota archaeon]|nr:class I SAM-dependent methyltransferase [Candidatus Woesearchaeota archaeon]